MHCRIVLPILACVLLAACTAPASRFEWDRSGASSSFIFVAEDYDLFPARHPEGEAWREQELKARLAAANVCADTYTIDQRQESTTPGRFFNGDIFRVTYRGHCGTAEESVPGDAPLQERMEPIRNPADPPPPSGDLQIESTPLPPSGVSSEDTLSSDGTLPTG